MLQFFLLFIFLFLAYKFLHTTKTQRFNLPPGPSGLPVIGHLHLLKPLIYRHFHNISQQYGPIFTLRFGLRRVVVVSSYPLVRKCFTGQNDIVLSNRPCSFTSKYVSYNNTTIGTIPYGDNWRNLRRICSLEILSSHRLATFLDIRRDEIRRMVTRLSRDNHTKNLDDSFKEVEIEPVLSDLTFNNIVRMVTGKRYYGVENDHNHEEEEAKMFKKLIKDLLENSGANQPSDYLPFLKFFGSKYEKKVKEVGECVDKFLQRLLDECRRNREENKNTMINHLMSLQDQEPEYYNDVTIKGLMMGMIIPGTDTASITIGWAMANLLNHRNILNKARQEIDEKIGQDRLLDELDIPNLPYLQNIVSETFRLYPVGPVLVPREAAADIKIGEYDVPRGTILLVNAWAIHRDPDLWDDPEMFCPERFNSTKDEESDDVRKLMPFGNGRRMCPAAGLGQRIVSWALGALVQCFDWENVNGEKIDMEESEGIAMRKLRPLRAMCRSRPVMSKLTCQFTSID